MGAFGDLYLYTPREASPDWAAALAAVYADLGDPEPRVFGSFDQTGAAEDETVAAWHDFRAGAIGWHDLVYSTEHRWERLLPFCSLSEAVAMLRGSSRMFIASHKGHFLTRLATRALEDSRPSRGELVLDRMSYFHGFDVLLREARGEMEVFGPCRQRFALSGYGSLGDWKYETDVWDYPEVLEWRNAIERHFGPMQAVLCWSC